MLQSVLVLPKLSSFKAQQIYPQNRSYFICGRKHPRFLSFSRFQGIKEPDNLNERVEQ